MDFHFFPFSGGNLEPWGRVIPFIIGCAPAIVAPLWEVTDRDIDIFTQVPFPKYFSLQWL